MNFDSKHLLTTCILMFALLNLSALVIKISEI